MTATMISANSAASMVDFLFSGVLHRYPTLKLIASRHQFESKQILRFRGKNLKVPASLRLRVRL